MILGGVAFLAGAAVSGAAVDVYMAILGRALLGLGLGFANRLTGINAVGLYAPVLLRTVGMEESASLLSTVMIVVIFTASTVVFMFVIDHFGRRTLLLAGGVQMLVSEVLIGGIMATKLGDEGGLSRMYALVLFILIGVYVAGYS